MSLLQPVLSRAVTLQEVLSVVGCILISAGPGLITQRVRRSNVIDKQGKQISLRAILAQAIATSSTGLFMWNPVFTAHQTRDLPMNSGDFQ